MSSSDHSNRQAEGASSHGRIPEPGRVMDGAEHCANATCQRPFDADYGFYLYRDVENLRGGLCVFCHDCAAYVELHHPVRFKLVAL